MSRSWLIGFIAFLLLAIAGILTGDLEPIYGKAIKICLECIGIG